jgi:hypothetical protein
MRCFMVCTPVIKCGKMGWAAHVARMGRREMCRGHLKLSIPCACVYYNNINTNWYTVLEFV